MKQSLTTCDGCGDLIDTDSLSWMQRPETISVRVDLPSPVTDTLFAAVDISVFRSCSGGAYADLCSNCGDRLLMLALGLVPMKLTAKVSREA